MKKRIISLLLALSMMISLVPVSALANTGGGIAPLAAGSVEVGNGLTINANGVPQGNDGANGTNWTYTSSSSGYGTLTLKSGIYDFSNQRLKDGMTINVETGVTAKNFKLRNDYNGNVTPKIDQPATLNNNGGTVEDAELHGLYNGTSINVNNSGTIKNSEFSNAEIVNEAGATIEGSSLVRADSSRTWLKNLGTVQECALYGAFFRDGKYGTITNCVAWGENEFPEGVQAAEITIDGDARWTITDPRMPDRLATDKFYIVGSPTLKIQIWDDVKRTIVPLSNIDGDTNGITTVEENGETWYQFTPDSSNKDSIVLNVREEHQLTVTGGGVIKKINGETVADSPTTKPVKETLKVTLEAPKQDGKTFKEWKVTAGTAPTDFVYKRNESYNLSDNPTSFYMPEGDVTLEATYYDGTLKIGEDGKPVTEGRKPYGNSGVQGDGWTYDGTTLKLIASDTSDANNEYDFSKDATIQVKVEVGKSVTVNNGTFADSVKNYGTIKNGKIKFCYNYGIIEGGTFDNTDMRYCASNYGTISNGTFKQSVDNNKDATKGTGTISGGGFEYVENHGVITDGTFKQCLNYGTVQGGEFISDGDYTCLMNDGEVQGGVVKGNVTNTKDCTISGGVFYKPVTNIGNIKGGMFLSTVSNSSNGGSISGGVFKIKPSDSSIANGAAYSITADGDGREISIKTSDVSDFVDFGTDGAYTVRTTSVQPKIVVKISAVIDTINGKSVSEYGAYEDDEHKSVKLTMPAEDIVLNQGATVTKYTLTVDGGYIGDDEKQTSGEFEANAQIKVTAKAKNGYHFTKWTVEKGTLNLSEKELEANPLTFDMLGELSLKANYEEDTPDPTPTPTTYTLTVKGDGAYIQDPTTGTEFDAGTVVMVDINVPDGKIFTGWTVSDGVKLSYIGADVDLHSEQIIFNMPAANVTLTANLIDQRTNILFNEDGTLNLDGVKNNSGDGWYYSEGALYLNPATATEYDFAHVDPQNKDGAKLDAVNVPIHVVNSTVTIAGGTFKAEVESTVTNATFKNCVFNGEVDIQTICNVDNCIFTKSSTITNLYGEQNCLFEKEPGGSIMTYELTEKTGATVTATLDGCEGEVSGTTLYFSGTPTLKVKVADGIVEKANNKPVGKADANGWYTVKAAEDDDGIVLNKGVTPDPEPKPDPKPNPKPTTYTVTTDSYGKVNGGASATVKEKDWVHMTVAEVPEGMTFDYWDIPDALLKALQKQNSGFRNNVESLSFQMPNMGEEEQTFAIKANFRSSELPGEDDGPSTLGTMATVAVGGAAAGILVWQGVSLGVDSYLQLNLPKGVAVPANRRELVVLLWETAGKPEAALPSLYSDVPAEEIELQKATRWAIDNGLVKPADDSDASRFDPDRYVTKYDVFGAWLKLKKLMK